MGRTIAAMAYAIAMAAAAMGVAQAASGEAKTPSVMTGGLPTLPHPRSEIRLAQAATAAPTLPGGATSLQERYQDWQVACAVQGSVKRCATSQQQVDPKSGQRVLGVELAMAGDKAEGALLLPFGLAFESGIILQIDDGAAGPVQRFRTCLPSGCVVPLSFDARATAALRKATSLKVKANADGGGDTTFSVSLKGFAGALDRAATLAR